MANKLSRIAYYVRRSRDTIHSEGWGKFVRKAISRCRELAYTANVACWFCRDLSEAIQHASRRGDFEVEVSLDERIVTWLKKHQKSFGWLYVPEEIRLKNACEHYYPTAVHNGKIVGYIKIGVDRVYIQDFDRILRLPARTAMIYDTFVLPDYRRKGVCSQLISESVKLLSDQGFDSVWCHIPPSNRASATAYSHAGFEQIARIKFVKILGCGIYSRNIDKMICR
ncbi:MAG: GNAT family N-acetyltransferase [Planctomycetota bacterium]|jgi:ribosomal protein S18 acetylase RimI-like enzyme